MKTAQRLSRHDAILARDLDAARQRDDSGHLLIGEIEGYCESPACAVRYVHITVKEHYPEERTRPPMTCPFCGRTLKLHHVRTGRERHEADVAQAYRTVAFDLIERRDNGFVNLGEVDRVADDLWDWTPPQAADA